MALHGADAWRRRTRAIKTVFKPVGREWTDRTVRLAKSRVRRVTGKTHDSIRRRNASMTRASVQASGGARFLEAGTTPHQIKPKRMKAMKFKVGGRTVFSKKVNHPGGRKQPFLRRSGHDALRGLDLLQELIELWNRAA